MDQDLAQLKSFINSLGPVSEDEMVTFLAIWKAFTTKRKETITASGETERFLYFVLEGVQRVFYFDEKGREATIVFTYPPSFGGILDSFMLQKTSSYTYEALTSSRLLKATYADFNKLTRSSPSIQQLMISGLSDTISGMMERMVELQSFSSEDKFLNLLKRSPHILQLVPHKYLANYIGIDPTNFSKLINKVKI